MHRFSLAPARRYQDHVPGGHDGRQALGQTVSRYRLEIAVKEASIVDSRLPRECLDSGSGGKRRPGFIEPDVPVGANPEYLQIDATCLAYRVLVLRTRGRDIGSQAVGALDRSGCKIDPGDEHVIDDRPIPLWMIGGQTNVLVECETTGLLK